MTEQEFDKLEWQFNCHINVESYYYSTDKCKTIPNLYVFVKVNHKDGVPTNKGIYTHYMLNEKIYKSKQDLLEAINND